jgi:hypothetical protein
MLMSIMLLSPGTDYITWLLLAFMTLIVDGWKVDFCVCPCVLALYWFFDAPPPWHFQSAHIYLWSHVACLFITHFFLSSSCALWQWCLLLLPVSLMPWCVFVLARMKFWMGTKVFVSCFTQECAP